MSPPSLLSDADIDALIHHATHQASPKDTRTQLFVGNLPFRVRWQDLKDLFRRAGTVLRADVALAPDGRSRGYGTVLLASAEEAGRAIDLLNGFSWQSRVLDVRPDRLPPSPPDAPLSTTTTTTTPDSPRLYSALLDLHYAHAAAPCRCIFVGNLPFSCQWQDLKDLFRRAGTVLRADVALAPDGRSRGFGTVSFATELDAEHAVELFDGFEYHGRQLKVNFDKYIQIAQLNAASSLPTSPVPHEAPLAHIPVFSPSASASSSSSPLLPRDPWSPTVPPVRRVSTSGGDRDRELRLLHAFHSLHLDPSDFRAGSSPFLPIPADTRSNSSASSALSLSFLTAASDDDSSLPTSASDHPSYPSKFSSPSPPSPLPLPQPPLPPPPQLSTKPRRRPPPSLRSPSSTNYNNNNNNSTNHPRHPGTITLPPPPFPLSASPLHSPRSPSHHPIPYGLPITPSMPSFNFIHPPPLGSPGSPGFAPPLMYHPLPSPGVYPHPVPYVSPLPSPGMILGMGMPTVTPGDHPAAVTMSPGAFWGWPVRVPPPEDGPPINPAVGAPVHVPPQPQQPLMSPGMCGEEPTEYFEGFEGYLATSTGEAGCSDTGGGGGGEKKKVGIEDEILRDPPMWMKGKEREREEEEKEVKGKLPRRHSSNTRDARSWGALRRERMRPRRERQEDGSDNDNGVVRTQSLKNRMGRGRSSEGKGFESSLQVEHQTTTATTVVVVNNDHDNAHGVGVEVVLEEEGVLEL